ncbi:MAG TPA: RodZ domain-containing protein [Actinomycetota bacterium]|nr:RodZ domain-containing protein [Actinomycetota bacterium]
MSTEEKTSLSPAPEETAQGGPGVGEKLREAREQRGVTIEQAAEATRISKRYLEALENDSPMDDLLNPAYGRLFLKNYAKYLDLDPDEVAPPPIEQPRMEPPVVDVLRPAMRPDGRLLSRVLMAAAVIALIGLAITRNYGEPQRETADTPPTSAPTPAQTGPASPNPSPSPSPTPATGLNGVLRVTDRSWVSVTADGENVIRETVDPPRSLTLEADRLLEVILGNGGGVRLRLNGELISTGDPGEVIRLSFAFQDGEVVQEVLPPEPTPESGGGD